LNDYDRLNPVTSKQAKVDFYQDLEKYASGEEKQEIQKHLSDLIKQPISNQIF